MNDSTHRLILMPSGRQGEVAHGMTVLHAAHLLGVDLEAICGGRQTCGKCLVMLERGEFLKHGIHSDENHLSVPNADERVYAAAHGLDLTQQRMACAAHITGDVLIQVPDSSLARKQAIRKAAGNLLIDVLPAVRLVYVEVEPPSLGSPGDWQRLQSALASQCDLVGLSIDAPLLHTLQRILRTGHWRVTVTLWKDREVIRIEPDYNESLFGLAIDVGTTTVVAHLCDLRTGVVLATEAVMNPQVRYGEDVMSRVSYGVSEAGGVARMHHAIIKVLNDLSVNTARVAGITASEITDVVLVGNTVMHHLLVGIDPVELGQMPFALATNEALDLKARELGLKEVFSGARLHLLPCIAGYVGADAVAVLLSEYPSLDERVTLIIDIGTNAEIILVARGRILAASSPTGPAFEGAQIKHGQRAANGAIERFRIDRITGAVCYQVIGDVRWSDTLPSGETLAATGICGSGIIEVVAELFAAGVVSPSGRLPPDAKHPRVRSAGVSGEFVVATAQETATGHDIVITQQDIRAIQLAKAALYAGVRLLMDHMEVTGVDHIKLAGAFGSYIDPRFAMIIGLIPDCDLSQVVSIGNAAGDGARIALLNLEQRREAGRLARRVEYVETAAHPRFHEFYVEAMTFPHASDTFPHLETIFANANK